MTTQTPLQRSLSNLRKLASDDDKSKLRSVAEHASAIAATRAAYNAPIIAADKMLPAKEELLNAMSNSEAAAVEKAMGLQRGKDFWLNEIDDPVRSIVGPNTNPNGPKWVVESDPRSYPYVHELGHINSPANKLPGAARWPYLVLAGGVSRLSPYVRGIDSYNKAYDEAMGRVEKTKGDKALDIASKATMLGTALRLGEEAIASGNAMRAVYKVQGKEGLRRSLHTYLGAYSTYIAAALAAHGIVPEVASRLGKYYAEKELERQAALQSINNNDN